MGVLAVSLNHLAGVASEFLLRNVRLASRNPGKSHRVVRLQRSYGPCPDCWVFRNKNY